MMFIILWLAGDVFNVLGAVLQGVLPTMIILAIYYTLADIVLWVQCIIYGDGKSSPDYVHLSPANPINEDVLETVLSSDRAIQCSDLDSARGEIDEFEISLKTSPIMSAFFKMLMVILVFLAGLGGWYISYMNTSRKHKAPVDLVFDPLAQFFGWLCALFYLGSRIPQILLNYERKSCDGISFMFFLFACLGNLTYVISILAIDTSWNYIWVNLSWLAGSLGTLALDFTIFVQFFLYNEGVDDDESSSLTNSTNTNSGEQLLSGRSEGYGTV